MELQKLLDTKKGDIIVLSDFNALEEAGGAVEFEVKTVHRYTHPESAMFYTSFEVQYGDSEMIFMVKSVGDEHDIIRYTMFSDGSFSEFVENVPSDCEETEGLPTGFILDPFSNGEEDEYLANEPFPIYGFKKNGKILCGLGEYSFNGEADSTYACKHALIEWYISTDEDADDLDNWHGVYFGNDVSLNDLDVLQGALCT